MDPRQTGLAPSFRSTRFAFGGGTLANYCGLSLLRVGNLDSYLKELKADAARGRGAIPRSPHFRRRASQRARCPASPEWLTSIQQDASTKGTR
jgi:hypothetical protein